jgi:hypothetical protein
MENRTLHSNFLAFKKTSFIPAISATIRPFLTKPYILYKFYSSLLRNQHKLRGNVTILKKIVLLTAIALVLCTSFAMADTGDPQVPETQGFVTSTIMSAIGTVTETDNIVTIIANCGGPEHPPIPYPLGDTWDHAEYTSTYTEDTIADQGLVTYTKGMTTDTAGVPTSNLFNVQTAKVVEFVGTDTGRMVSDERTVLDGAGSAFYDQSILICPFVGETGRWNPPFCNIVEEGSSVDLTLGSLTTETAQRYIMQSAGFFLDTPVELPISDPGVESDYSIKLTGFGDVPAMGSADAFINVHVQEGRAAPDFGAVANYGYQKAEDLVYSETSTARGDITLFQKVMSYNSKITQPGAIGPIPAN